MSAQGPPLGNPVRLSLADKWRLFRAWQKLNKDPLMLEKLKSRKFWVTVVGGAIVLAGNQLGIDEAVTTKIVALIASYVIGQGISDVTAPGK